MLTGILDHFQIILSENYQKRNFLNNAKRQGRKFSSKNEEYEIELGQKREIDKIRENDLAPPMRPLSREADLVRDNQPTRYSLIIIPHKNNTKLFEILFNKNIKMNVKKEAIIMEMEYDEYEMELGQNRGENIENALMPKGKESYTLFTYLCF